MAKMLKLVSIAGCGGQVLFFKSMVRYGEVLFNQWIWNLKKKKGWVLIFWIILSNISQVIIRL